MSRPYEGQIEVKIYFCLFYMYLRMVGVLVERHSCWKLNIELVGESLIYPRRKIKTGPDIFEIFYQ